MFGNDKQQCGCVAFHAREEIVAFAARIKSSQSLNSLCITVRRVAEMCSLCANYMVKSTSHNYMLHTIRMNYLMLFYAVCERVAEWNYPRRVG